MTSAAEIEIPFHGGKLSVPKDVVVKTWLDKVLGRADAPNSPVPAVGDYWDGQGGIYAGYIRGENGALGWHVIVPTHPSATNDSIKWGIYGTSVDGAKSHTDGLANTKALIELGADYQAATWAADLEIDGHKDFYLPSRRELALAEINIADLFVKGWYWTSTQSSADSAWLQDFVDGYQVNAYKDYAGRARAVRRLQF